MRLLCLIVICTFFIGWDYSSELKKIQEDIRNENLGWIAGETSMIKKSPQERRAYLMPTPPEIKSTNVFTSDKFYAYPSKLDYRDFFGYNWMTPVRNQGSCGSCWAFSTLGSLEAIIKIYNSDPSMDLDLSEQELVSCTITGSCAYGGSQLFAANYIKSNGITDEACFPYIAQEGDCKDKCSNPKIFEKIKDAGMVGFFSIASENDIKAALIKYGPIPTSMKVYSDFYAYRGGVYQRSSNSREEGWHAIVFVGWDDSKNAWLCKNSWGEDFGEKGYFWIKKGDSYIGWGTEYIIYKDDLKPRLCSSVNEINLNINIKESSKQEFEFDIFNCGSWVFEWNASPTEPYIHIVDKNGVAIRKPTVIKGFVDASLLSVGNYTSYINIKSDVAENSPLLIPIRITVWRKELQDVGVDFDNSSDVVDDVTNPDIGANDVIEHDISSSDNLYEELHSHDVEEAFDSPIHDTSTQDIIEIGDSIYNVDHGIQITREINSTEKEEQEHYGGCGCGYIN
ncbi:MAG: C1 family peptidase [Deltaproteobacteria bacterium]|nr:C1 family peptidase [Deltaproteobacteria bacterium]